MTLDSGSGAWREYIEPSAHESEPPSTMTSASRAPGACVPDAASAPTRSATPLAPIARPPISAPDGRVPPGRSHSMRTNQTGVMATISATRPEAVNFSPQVTLPLPRQSMKSPVTAVARTCVKVGRGVRCAMAQPTSSNPAITMRLPDIRKGGMLSIARRIEM